MVDTLAVLHNLESFLGFGLECDEGDRVLDYLNGDPSSTEPAYLAELFELTQGQKMKPSQRCKAAGLKSLDELSQITGESVQTLNNWSKNKPRLFEVVLLGAVATKAASAISDSKI